MNQSLDYRGDFWAELGVTMQLGASMGVLDHLCVFRDVYWRSQAYTRGQDVQQ